MKLALAALSLGTMIAAAQPAPTLTAASIFGGSRDDAGSATVLDPHDGSIWFAGTTVSPDFPVTQNAYQRAARGKDAFLSKFSASGHLLYSTRLGGNFDDAATAIAIDADRNVYVTGTTDSNNFPRAGYVVSQTVVTPARTSINFFLAKFDANGRLLYSRQFGGSGHDYANAIALGPFPTGSAIYISGRTYSTNFPMTQTALFNRLRGPSDAFLTAIQIPAGSPGNIVYSTYLGGSGNESAKGVAVSGGGRAGVDVYLAGWTESHDFPVSQGAWRPRHGGGQTDAFAVRINLHNVVYITAGPNPLAAISYATFVGAESDDAANGLVVDSTGAAYLTGYTRSSGFPTTRGSYQPGHGGGAADAFVVKLNATGALVFSTLFGGYGEDIGRAITLDVHGHVFFVGSTDSPNLPVTRDAAQTDLAGGADSFVAEISADGRTLLYSTYVGDFGPDVLGALSTHHDTGSLVAAGWSRSKDAGDSDLLIVTFRIY